MKKKRENYRIRAGGGVLGFIWNSVVVVSTLSGALYMGDVIKNCIYTPKKRIYDIYDEDVIQQTSEIISDSVRKGIEMDYDEILNKFQEIKNLKIKKKDE